MAVMPMMSGSRVNRQLIITEERHERHDQAHGVEQTHVLILLPDDFIITRTIQGYDQCRQQYYERIACRTLRS